MRTFRIALLVLTAACVTATAPSIQSAKKPPAHAATVAKVVVSPDTMTLTVKEVGKAACTPTNKFGAVLTNGCTWTAKDTTVAKPTSGSQSTSITARKAGSTLIIAVSGGKADTLRLTVRDTAVVLPADTTPPPPPVGEQAAAADSFFQSVGVNTHNSYGSGTPWPNKAFIKSLLVDLGVKHLREGGNAYRSGNANLYAALVDWGATLGIRYDILATPFETDQSVWSFTDTRGIDTVAKYLGPYVESWEGLNEWNSKRTTRANWAAEDKQWQQTLWSYRAAHPGPQVIGPSFTRYVDACTVGDLSAWMDFGNMHPYPAGRMQSASLQANIDGLACENGADPLYATETGYQTALQSTSGNRAISEAGMGKYVPRMYLWNFNQGVRRTYEYELIDEGVDQTNAEKTFGLYRNAGAPKPAATNLKQLLALTTDAGAPFTPGLLDYALTGDLTNVAHTLLQKRDGHFLLAVWLEVSSWDEIAKVDRVVAPRALVLTFPSARSGSTTPIPGSALPWGPLTSLPLTVTDAVTVVDVAP